MKAVILRLDAPLMSFGATVVDQHGFTDIFPGKSMLTGLIANALGWEHGDFSKLQDLQERLDYAARWDVEPIPSIDYHTVDLGSDKMRNAGWTTFGEPEHRAGGSAAKYGTHQRYRHYLEDGLMTIALTIREDEVLNTDVLLNAFKKPCRPLFVGRKTCLPARPLLDPDMPLVEGAHLVSILEKVPVWDRLGQPIEPGSKRHACWSDGSLIRGQTDSKLVFDLRDWANQLPAGTRWRYEGMIGGRE